MIKALGSPGLFFFPLALFLRVSAHPCAFLREVSETCGPLRTRARAICRIPKVRDKRKDTGVGATRVSVCCVNTL